MVSAWREQLSADPPSRSQRILSAHAKELASIHHKSDAGQWALGLEVLPTELARDDEVIE